MTEPLLDALARAVGSHYTIERPLGSRGDVAVFLARDLRLERPVVLYVLPPGATGEARARFVARATQAARLAHPNIVPIHEVDGAGDLAWYVASFVHGRSLASRLETDGPLPPSAAARLARELAWALAYAHEAGLVHGDLGPAEVFLEDGTDRAMITGFGNLPSAAAPDPAGDLRGLVATVVAALSRRAARLPVDPAAVVAQLPAWAAGPLATLITPPPGAAVPSAAQLAGALTPPVRAEVPPILRQWLEARNPLKVFLVTWSGVETMLWLLNSGGTVDTYILNCWSPWLLTWPVAVHQLRPVLRAGFGRPDVLGVLDQQLRARREEMEVRGAGRGSRLTAWLVLLGLLGFGATRIDTFLVAHSPLVHFLFLLIGLMLLGLGLRAWRDRGRPEQPRDELMEARVAFWRGPLGRWTFRLARLGLRPGGSAGGAFDQRPTTVILADSIRELAGALPRSLLGQFPDVLRTVDRLERAAALLRDRVRRLEALPRPDAAALQAARDRHADAVVALETMRLALLAAQGRAVDIGAATQELADAVAMADRIQHLAVGKDAVGLEVPG